MKKLFFLISIIFISNSFAAINPKIPWTFSRDLSEKPRGGTSTGIAVIYDQEIPTAWTRLQEANLSKYERDRRAIYALEGEYEVKFNFIETFLMDPKNQMDRPYVSWGTEYVKVIEDRGDFISLQHIMVMFYKDPTSGEETGPMVMKHWRQEWKWENNTYLEYQGYNTWHSKKIAADRVNGKWTWIVYQVDDSPRYSGIGEWEHFPSASTFTTGRMSRPLPRREKSVLSDYEILFGKDTIVVTPKAWYHEQRNFKQKGSTFLAREIGHNSYIRIKDFDFSAGFDYWKKTQAYWSDVRMIWEQVTAITPRFKMKGRVEDRSLYEYHFEQAQNQDVLNMDQEKRAELILETIYKFLEKILGPI